MEQAASGVRLLFAFLLVWLPYIAATGLQEGLGRSDAAGPVLMALALLLCWPAARLIGGRDPFALRLDRRVLLLFVTALAIGISLQAARLLVGSSSGALTIELFAGPGLTLAIVATAAITTFVPSLAEDILTRGFPLFAAKPRIGSLLLLAGLSALIYTLNHLWRLSWGWPEQARLFAMGLAYALAALRFRTLWAAVGLHWGWNLALAMTPAAMKVEQVDQDADRLLGAALHLAVAAVLWLQLRRARDTQWR
jgi:membrane protease YdiL (CAAX protease family)